MSREASPPGALYGEEQQEAGPPRKPPAPGADSGLPTPNAEADFGEMGPEARGRTKRMFQLSGGGALGAREGAGVPGAGFSRGEPGPARRFPGERVRPWALGLPGWRRVPALAFRLYGSHSPAAREVKRPRRLFFTYFGTTHGGRMLG